MTVPFQPPAQTWGRTAKELVGLGGRYGIPSEPPHPVLPLVGLHGFGFVLVQQPAAATFYGWLLRPWYDAGWATHVRLVTDVAVAGAPGSRYVFQRCTDIVDPDDDLNWGTVGLLRECVVPLDVIGPQKGKWIELSNDAQGENIFRAVAIGGDGILSPEHGLLWAEFKFKRKPLADRWYWRDAPPGDTFNWDNPNTYYGDFWSVGATQDVWLTPTPATVTANQSTLSKIKDTIAGAAVVSSTSTDAHIDVSGIVKRFVGAPLRKQTIPAWTYRMGFAAQAPSGGVAGYAHFQIGIFRPSAPTAPLILWEDLATPPQAIPPWFRFATKQRIYSLDVEEDFDVEDGDRLFIDIIGNVDVASGISTTNGLGVNIHFDGAGLEAFVDGADLAGADPASWIELPLLAYLSRDAE